MKYLIFAIVIIMSCAAFGQTASVNLTWTAPGDDSTVGTASQYDLRMSTDSTALVNSFTTATKITVPAPKPAGSKETFVVTGLLPNTTYFFALKTADEVPNWSPISNIFKYKTPDTIAPAKVTDLRAE